MKLIIDIPEDMLEWFKNGEIIEADKAESEDFPQTKDIEPTVKGFVDTMNRWGDLVEEGRE